MKKIYQEPDVEFLRLVPMDKLMGNDDSADGDMGLKSSIFG
jgi:hypothetical protein